MDDREFNAQVRRIKALIKKWHNPLGLFRWEIKHSYVRANYEVDGEANHAALASVKVRWEYQHATIAWNMPLAAETKDDELEQAFVHECMHVLLAEMREWEHPETAMKHEEHVATSLAYALMWTREEGAKDEA